jgi:hypothetical protein
MSDDLSRRRAILMRAIGLPVQLKRSAIKPRDPLRGRVGTLADVRRTRVTIEYGAPDEFGFVEEHDKWDVSIPLVLLPGSIEPLPGQRELFALEATE